MFLNVKSDLKPRKPSAQPYLQVQNIVKIEPIAMQVATTPSISAA